MIQHLMLKSLEKLVAGYDVLDFAFEATSVNSDYFEVQVTAMACNYPRTGADKSFYNCSKKAKSIILLDGMVRNFDGIYNAVNDIIEHYKSTSIHDNSKVWLPKPELVSTSSYFAVSPALML